MKTQLGKQGWQCILYNTQHFRVYEIQLTLNDHANHNIVFPYDALLFTAEGQVFIQSNLEEVSLKANQAVWVQHALPIRCVTISPITRLFVVVFLGQTKRNNPRFDRFASGTEDKKQHSNGTTQWTAKNKDVAKIDWHMFPALHQEPFYYLKASEQFILPVNTKDDLHIQFPRQSSQSVHDAGILIESGTTRRLINRSEKPITFLTIATPYPKQSRIIKLGRSS